MKNIVCIKCGIPPAFPSIANEPYVCIQCQTPQQSTSKDLAERLAKLSAKAIRKNLGNGLRADFCLTNGKTIIESTLINETALPELLECVEALKSFPCKCQTSNASEGAYDITCKRCRTLAALDAKLKEIGVI